MCSSDLMAKLGIPVTEEMIAQFENYKSDQYAILDQMESLMEILPEQLAGGGFASMLCAAKVLALSGLRLLEEPRLVQEAWDNFHAHQTEPYVSPLPEGLMPDLEQVKEN